MKNIYLFEQWDENATKIKWQLESRKKLNKIIHKVNKWQTKHGFSSEKADVILARIDFGIRTIGSLDGGDGYLECLEEMKKFVLANK